MGAWLVYETLEYGLVSFFLIRNYPEDKREGGFFSLKFNDLLVHARAHISAFSLYGCFVIISGARISIGYGQSLLQSSILQA